MAKRKTREQLEQAWWDQWHREDFSWEGLAKRPWEGWSVLSDDRIVETRSRDAKRADARPATLQDYWRGEKEHLIAGDGGSWTRAHCPPAWADGTPTVKAHWDEAQRASFESMLSERLAAATAINMTAVWHRRRWHERNSSGPDRRAQFQGAVLFGAPRHPTVDGELSARFERAAFSGDARFANLRLLPGASFAEAMFCEGAHFDTAHFLGEAHFDDAIFHGLANFSRVRFHDQADFHTATFNGHADFHTTSFDRSAIFSNATFFSSASFWDATFGEQAYFPGATFYGDVHFTGASILAGGRFEAVRFKQGCFFDGAKLSPYVRFENVSYDGLNGIAFRVGAVFLGLLLPAAFLMCLWLTLDEGPWRWIALTLAIPFAIAALVWSCVGGSVWAGSGFWMSAPRLALKDFFKYGDIPLANYEMSFRTLKYTSGAVKNHAGEAVASALELKASRLRLGHPFPWALVSKSAERFFSVWYEILSNYALSVWRPVFWLIAIAVFCAALFWAWEGGGLAPRAAHWRTHTLVGGTLDPAFVEAMEFSLSRVLPFGLWSDEARRRAEPVCTFSERLLAEGRAGQSNDGPACAPAWLAVATDAEKATHRFWVRFAATLQSFLSIVLVFLFALAMRRRFQIS